MLRKNKIKQSKPPNLHLLDLKFQLNEANLQTFNFVDPKFQVKRENKDDVECKMRREDVE